MLTKSEREICRHTGLSEEAFAKAKAETLTQRRVASDGGTVFACGVPQPLPFEDGETVTADVKAILKACGVSVEHYLATRKRDA